MRVNAIRNIRSLPLYRWHFQPGECSHPYPDEMFATMPDTFYYQEDQWIIRNGAV
jgi:hypothetical protein